MLMKGGVFQILFQGNACRKQNLCKLLEPCLSSDLLTAEISTERAVFDSLLLSSSSTAVALRIYVIKGGSPRALDSRCSQSVCCYPDHSACGVIITDAGVMSVC